MNKEQLYKILDNNLDPTPSDTGRLKELADRYPFFEVAKLLYLKSLYMHDILSFKSELSRLSVLLSDREALFYYIFRNDYAQYFHKTGNQKLEPDKTDLLLNAFFEDLEPSLSAFEYESNNNLASTDYLTFLEEETVKQEREERFSFRKEESFSNLIFFENKKEEEDEEDENYDEDEDDDNYENEDDEQIEHPLDIIKKEPIQLQPIAAEHLLDKKEKKQEKPKPLKHQSIIDSFIEKSKDKEFSIKLNKEDLKHDKDYPAEEEVKIDAELGEDMFFTETLAKIYTKQGRFQKAYEIIEHLSLKYPKKNSYFADQLSYLDKLIINSKYNKNKK